MHKTCSLQIPHVLALKFNFRTLQTETTSTNFKNLMLTDKNKNNVKCYISHSIIIIICSGKPTLENFSMLIICRTEAVTNLFYSLSKSAWDPFNFSSTIHVDITFMDATGNALVLDCLFFCINSLVASHAYVLTYIGHTTQQWCLATFHWRPCQNSR